MYLLFYHGDTFFTDFVMSPTEIGENDLIMSQDQFQNYNVLRNGRSILNNLHQLSQRGYQLVFVSKAGQNAQRKIIAELEQACSLLGFPLPHIIQIANEKRATTSLIIGSQQYLTALAIERLEIEQVLNIHPGTYSQHVVFDTDVCNISAYARENYQALVLGPTQTSLNEALNKITDAQAPLPLKLLTPTAPPLTLPAEEDSRPTHLYPSTISFFQPAAQPSLPRGVHVYSYLDLSLEFRQYISEVTEEDREQLFAGFSTEELWENLSPQKRQQLCDAFIKLNLSTELPDQPTALASSSSEEDLMAPHQQSNDHESDNYDQLDDEFKWFIVQQTSAIRMELERMTPKEYWNKFPEEHSVLEYAYLTQSDSASAAYR